MLALPNARYYWLATVTRSRNKDAICCPRTSFANLSSRPSAAGIYKRDVPRNIGRDQTTADRLNDVLMLRLQIFERTALIFQFDIYLSQARGQPRRQVSDRHVADELDNQRGLQRNQRTSRDGGLLPNNQSSDDNSSIPA